MLLSAAILTAMVAGTPSIKDMPLPCTSLAQSAEEREQLKAEKGSKRKLTRKDQRAAQLLQSIEAEASAAQLAMQGYLFLRLANLWMDCDANAKNAEPMILQALESSKEVDDSRGLKTSLQVGLANRLSEDELLKHISDFTEDARAEVVPTLGQRLARANRYEDAVALFEPFADAKEFPFFQAGQVVKLLPENAGVERRRIFNLAMQSARGNTNAMKPGLYDLGSLVVDCWRYLPESQMNDAIDQLLQEARDEVQPTPISFASGKNEISFQNAYQYRLFQLLPVIRKINESKAEALMNMEPGVRVALAKYPEGMQSVRSTDAVGTTMSIGADPSRFARLSAAHNRIRALMNDGKFREALDEILSLPQGENARGRVSMLLNFAINTLFKEKSIAKEAMGAAEADLGTLKGRQYTEEALRACGIWTMMKSPERCDPLLVKATKQLEDSIKEDTSRPNLAFKGYWPSVFQLEGVVYFTCKRNPKEADEMVNGIHDADVKTIVRIAEARCLLGLDREFWMAQEITDNDQKMYSAF